MVRLSIDCPHINISPDKTLTCHGVPSQLGALVDTEALTCSYNRRTKTKRPHLVIPGSTHLVVQLPILWDECTIVRYLILQSYTNVSIKSQINSMSWVEENAIKNPALYTVIYVLSDVCI